MWFVSILNLFDFNAKKKKIQKKGMRRKVWREKKWNWLYNNLCYPESQEYHNRPSDRSKSNGFHLCPFLMLSEDSIDSYIVRSLSTFTTLAYRESRRSQNREFHPSFTLLRWEWPMNGPYQGVQRGLADLGSNLVNSCIQWGAGWILEGSLIPETVTRVGIKIL